MTDWRGPLQVVVLAEFPNHEIHRDGRVFRIRGQGQGEVHSHPGNRQGYFKIKLRHAGVRHSFWLHRLICRAFHGDPPVYPCGKTYVRHIDNNPANNHADNLQYGSRSENEQDKKRFCAPLVGRALSEEYDTEFFD